MLLEGAVAFKDFNFCLQYVYAATARTRFMNKDYVVSRGIAADYPKVPELRVGILFGRESSGLTNAEVALANKILTVDSSADYAVLNLAQAICVTCYELFPLWATHFQVTAGGSETSGDTQTSSLSSLTSNSPAQISEDRSAELEAPSSSAIAGGSGGDGGDGENFASSIYSGNDSITRPAVAQQLVDANGDSAVDGMAGSLALASKAAGTIIKRSDLVNAQTLASKQDMQFFLQHLFEELEQAQFFEDANKRESVQINIQNLFGRIDKLSKGEVQTLRGVVAKLAYSGSSRRRSSAAQQKQS